MPPLPPLDEGAAKIYRMILALDRGDRVQRHAIHKEMKRMKGAAAPVLQAALLFFIRENGRGPANWPEQAKAIQSLVAQSNPFKGAAPADEFDFTDNPPEAATPADEDHALAVANRAAERREKEARWDVEAAERRAGIEAAWAEEDAAHEAKLARWAEEDAAHAAGARHGPVLPDDPAALLALLADYCEKHPADAQRVAEGLFDRLDAKPPKGKGKADPKAKA